jgi:hypothetical protein
VETCWPKEGHNCINGCGSWGILILKTNQHVLNENMMCKEARILFGSRLLRGFNGKEKKLM